MASSPAASFCLATFWMMVMELAPSIGAEARGLAVLARVWAELRPIPKREKDVWGRECTKCLSVLNRKCVRRLPASVMQGAAAARSQTDRFLCVAPLPGRYLLNAQGYVG